jgi:hypothetical protein
MVLHLIDDSRLVGLDSIVIEACSCSPITHQLLSRALFPCAPTNPSLAVDIPLLQFTRDLFVRASPNVTSFTEALESFLDYQGYDLHRQVCGTVFTTAEILH